MAYKLVRYGERDVLKISPGKETWTGAKQVFRRRDADGRALGDILALHGESCPPHADPLLETMMEAGRLIRPLPPLAAMRAHCAQALGALPEAVLRLSGAARYPVRASDALARRQQEIKSAAVAREVAAD